MSEEPTTFSELIDLLKSMTERMDRIDKNIERLDARITNMGRELVKTEDWIDKRLKSVEAGISFVARYQ